MSDKSSKKTLEALSRKYAKIQSKRGSTKQSRRHQRIKDKVTKKIAAEEKQIRDKESAEKRFQRNKEKQIAWEEAQKVENQTEEQQRRAAEIRATTEHRETQRVNTTEHYAPVINALNAGILPSPLIATTAELSVNRDLIMISLENTNNILPNLTGVHITFVVNRPQSNHITFNVPTGWNDSRLPSNASDIRIGITKNTMNFNYRINNNKQQPLNINSPPNQLPQTIKQNIISQSTQNLYSILRLRNMFTTAGNILDTIRNNIYTKHQLSNILTTIQGGAKSRKSSCKSKRKKHRTRRLKNKRN